MNRAGPSQEPPLFFYIAFALAEKKSEGVKLGRPRGSSKKKVTFCKEYDAVRLMLESGKTTSFIARKYGIHRNTVRKYIKEMENLKIL